MNQKNRTRNYLEGSFLEEQVILPRELQGLDHRWCCSAQVSIIVRESRLVSMSGFGPGRSNMWNIYTGADPTPSQAAIDSEAEAPWKGFGASVNAISFGFMATAILVSLFLIMAIFEHLFRPSPSFTSPGASRSGAGMAEKLGNPHNVSTSYVADFSVMMPGQDYPTFIAQPAPLPFPREGIHFPPHGRNFPESVT